LARCVLGLSPVAAWRRGAAATRARAPRRTTAAPAAAAKVIVSVLDRSAERPAWGPVLPSVRRLWLVARRARVATAPRRRAARQQRRGGRQAGRNRCRAAAAGGGPTSSQPGLFQTTRRCEQTPRLRQMSVSSVQQQKQNRKESRVLFREYVAAQKGDKETRKAVADGELSETQPLPRV
jgi:hypothetical protein